MIFKFIIEVAARILQIPKNFSCNLRKFTKFY